MSEIDLNTRVTQGRDLLMEDLDDELLMMSLEAGLYIALNPIAKRIWNELKGPIMVADVCQRLLTEFDVPPETCERDVLSLLNQLHDKHLIQSVPTTG